jgi:hypothetical protein
MKQFILKMLREAMIPFTSNWRENSAKPFKDGNSLIVTTLISKDDETGDKLWLLVGLEEKDGYYEFTMNLL